MADNPRRRRGGNRARPRRNNQRRVILREVDGFMFKPAATPPPFHQAPWNGLVVAIIAATPAQTPYQLEYTATNIWAQAQLQLGLNVTTLLAELRFQRVEVWATSNSELCAIALTPLDVTGDSTTNTRSFARLEDHCGKNQWARCGFQWPRSIQNTVVESASTAPVVQVRTNTSMNAYLRVHILWRGTNNSVPTFGAAYTHVEENIFECARAWNEPRPRERPPAYTTGTDGASAVFSCPPSPAESALEVDFQRVDIGGEVY